MRALLSVGLPTVAKKDAGIFFVSGLISKVGGLIAIPVYTRMLSEEEYGLVSLYQSALTLLPLWLSLGCVSSISNLYFRESDELRRWSVMRAGFGRVCAVVMVSTVLHEGILLLLRMKGMLRDEGARPEMALATGALLAIGSMGDAVLRAERRALQSLLLSVSVVALTTGTGVLLMLFGGGGVDAVVEAQLVGACVFAVGTGLLFFSKRNVGSNLQVNVSVGGMLRFSLPFVPHFLASWGYSVADRWVLSGFGLGSELGRYAVAGQVVSPVALASSALNDVQSPAMGRVRLEQGSQGLGRVALAGLRQQLQGVALMSVLVASCLPLVPIVFGQRYSAAVPVALVLLVVALIEGGYYPAVNLLYFRERTVLIPVATVVAALVSLGMVMAFVPLAGFSGLLGARLGGALFRTGFCWWLARTVRA